MTSILLWDFFFFFFKFKESSPLLLQQRQKKKKNVAYAVQCKFFFFLEYLGLSTILFSYIPHFFFREREKKKTRIG